MINLFDAGIDIENARKNHREFFEKFLDYKIFKRVPYHTYMESFCARRKPIVWKSIYLSELIDFLQENSRYIKLIDGNPEEILQIHNEFVDRVNLLFPLVGYDVFVKASIKDRVTKYKEMFEFLADVESVFDYKGFTNLEADEIYSAYRLAENLGIRSCTYCNRVYALTHTTRESKKLLRPQFDHWFPKSIYPLLAISFYNLIPSCIHCNSGVKKNKEMNLINFAHPYMTWDKNDDFTYTYDYFGGINEYRVICKSFQGNNKVKDTVEFLKINEMYEGHQYELSDLIKTKQAYSSEYLEILKTAFPEANLSKNEIFRLVFGTELIKSDFHKRPFSKFKSDILRELGVID